MTRILAFPAEQSNENTAEPKTRRKTRLPSTFSGLFALDIADRKPRGVYFEPYTRGGLPVMYALDSRGECVKRFRIPDETEPEVLALWLEGYLERVDPQPKLGLVPPEAG